MTVVDNDENPFDPDSSAVPDSESSALLGTRAASSAAWGSTEASSPASPTWAKVPSGGRGGGGGGARSQQQLLLRWCGGRFSNARVGGVLVITLVIAVAVTLLALFNPFATGATDAGASDNSTYILPDSTDDAEA